MPLGMESQTIVSENCVAFDIQINLSLTHWGRGETNNISQTTFSYVFSSMRISVKISLKFVSKGPIKNILAWVQIMAWCRPGDKPLSAPMMVSFSTHICVTRPEWVNSYSASTLQSRHMNMVSPINGMSTVCSTACSSLLQKFNTGSHYRKLF